MPSLSSFWWAEKPLKPRSTIKAAEENASVCRSKDGQRLTDAFGLLLGRRLGVDDEGRGDGSIGDPELVAARSRFNGNRRRKMLGLLEDVSIALLLGAQSHGNDVRA
jgi:hypothetical protein